MEPHEVVKKNFFAPLNIYGGGGGGARKMLIILNHEKINLTNRIFWGKYLKFGTNMMDGQTCMEKIFYLNLKNKQKQ